jgi:hypothetical protein
MRPPADDRAIEILRRQVPEFDERFLDLLGLYGEDLTAEAVFMELADFLTELLVGCGAPGILDRCFAVAGEVAEHLTGGADLVGYALFNEMPPVGRALARPHLSTAMAALLERLERGETVEEAEGSGPEGRWQSRLDGVDTPPAELSELGLSQGVIEGREPQAEAERPLPLAHPRPPVHVEELD